MNYWSSIFISYWQGDMTKTMEFARKLDSAGGPVSSIFAGMGRIYFACAAALSGHDHFDEASALLDKVSDEIQHGMPWPLHKAVASASIHWARGNLSEAVKALEIVESHTGITTTLAMAADLWRRIGHPDRALDILTLIDTRLLVSYTEASIRFTQAVIAWDQGDKNEAHRLLGICLEAAVPQSVAAPMIHLDHSARALLTDHMARGTIHERFIAERLTADSSVQSPTGAETEPLSARESEVLSYLGSTMTAIEIAEALFASPATVRSHQHSIYRKLNVTNRRDAVRVGNKIQSS